MIIPTVATSINLGHDILAKTSAKKDNYGEGTEKRRRRVYEASVSKRNEKKDIEQVYRFRSSLLKILMSGRIWENLGHFEKRGRCSRIYPIEVDTTAKKAL
ncbi:Hypothetical predicted protein [Octopus vulgaris]|uniref:Uncharacterized protein n=1 Tax=Octopus vulgaris TaxID=6645 RepID=A0AA36B2B8_OCTVU|nr:Hypothetical predicted protein [Octopus vulgaris]